MGTIPDLKGDDYDSIMQQPQVRTETFLIEARNNKVIVHLWQLKPPLVWKRFTAHLQPSGRI